MTSERWNNASSRERLLVVVMVLIVCGALGFALLVRPAWRVVRAAPATLQTLDTRVLTMRTHAAQLRAAPAAAAVATPAAAALLFATERDLGGPGATVSDTRDATSAGTAMTLTLKGVDGAQLATWLAKPEVQTQLQQMNLARDAISGRVSGTVTVRISI